MTFTISWEIWRKSGYFCGYWQFAGIFGVTQGFSMLIFYWDPGHLSDEPPVEGPPIPVTIGVVKKAISQMKAGKVLGPSGIVVEMIRAAGDTGASMIRDLAAAIIRDGTVPSDWEQNFIVCLYKGKGDALERENYRGLKLTEQIKKVLERIVDGLIRQLVSIDDSQFGFVPGRGTTDAIFVSGSCKRSI